MGSTPLLVIDVQSGPGAASLPGTKSQQPKKRKCVKSPQPNGFSKCYAYGFQAWGGQTVAKPTVFIGSSEANVKVANAIADGLDDCATVTVWDEGVFRLNDAFLQRLLAAPSQFDFAVM